MSFRKITIRVADIYNDLLNISFNNLNTRSISDNNNDPELDNIQNTSNDFDKTYIDDFEKMLLEKNRKIEVKKVNSDKSKVIFSTLNELRERQRLEIEKIERKDIQSDEKGSVNDSIRNIGDVALEDIMNLLGEGIPFDDFITLRERFSLKKDYASVIITDPQSDITRFSVYTLSYANKTYVLTVTYKKNMNIPMITYDETVRDPSDLVEEVYSYDMGRERTLLLRRVLRQQNIPERLQSLLIPSHSDQRPDMMFQNIITIDNIAQELVELDITIKNGQYISKTPVEKLLAVTTAMNNF